MKPRGSTYEPTNDDLATVQVMLSRFSTRREGLAWAAGFFDGEGCFSVARDKRANADNPHLSMRLMLAQVDPLPLIQFQCVIGLGGRLASDAASQRRTCHRLQINGFEFVQAAALMMWPFLSPHKRTQYTEKSREMLDYFAQPRAWKGWRIDNTCVLCGKPAQARRLCNTHYWHWWKEQRVG